MYSVGAKGAESGGKERQIQRLFHPDYYLLRMGYGLFHISDMNQCSQQDVHFVRPGRTLRTGLGR
jgi:hypothetical protein